MELSKEKQLHLLEPALQLIDSIKDIHYSWLNCLYYDLLNHNQSKIVHYTARKLLQQKWIDSDEFVTIMTHLLNAINKNEINSDVIQTFKELHNFTINLSKEKFINLIELSLNVKWIPGNLYLFYKNLFHYEYVNEAEPLLINMIQQVVSLPDKFIREACLNQILLYLKKSNATDFTFYKDLLSFFANNQVVFDFVLKEIIPFEKITFNELSIMTKVLKNNELLNHADVDLTMKLLLFKNEKSEMKILLKDLMSDLEENKFSNEISVALLIYLVDEYVENKNYMFLGTYLKKNLMEIKSIDLLSSLIKIIYKIQPFKQEFETFEFVKLSEDILNQPDHYNEFQISLAFNIYNTISEQTNLKMVISNWQKYLTSGRRYQSSTYVCFLYLYLKEFSSYVDGKKQVLKAEIMNVLEYLFEIQCDNVIKLIIVNIPTFVAISQILTTFILTKCLEKLLEMKSSPAFKAMIESFVETVCSSLTIKTYFPQNLLNTIEKLVELSNTHLFIGNALAIQLFENMPKYSYGIKKKLVDPMIELLLLCDMKKKSDRYVHFICIFLFIDFI